MRNHFEWIDKDSLFALLKGEHGSPAFACAHLIAGGKSGKVRSFAKFIINSELGEIEERDLDADFWKRCKAQERVEHIDEDQRKGTGRHEVKTGRLCLSVPAVVGFSACNIYFHKSDANLFWFNGSNLTLMEGESLIGHEASATAAQPLRRRKGPGGRGGDFKWEKCLIEAARWMHVEGVPPKQADLLRYIAEWFGDDGPSDTQLKEHLGPLYLALKTGEPSD